jgi:hypothetical protein
LSYPPNRSGIGALLIRPVIEQEAHNFGFALEGREGRKTMGGWKMTGKGEAGAKDCKSLKGGKEGRVRGKEE